MDPSDIGLFRLAEKRLNWIEQRQQVLAQNIANASTPDYKARDLSPVPIEASRIRVSPLRKPIRDTWRDYIRPQRAVMRPHTVKRPMATPSRWKNSSARLRTRPATRSSSPISTANTNRCSAWS